MTASLPQMVAVGPRHAAVVAALSKGCLDDPWSAAAVANILSTPGAFGFVAMISGIPRAFILCRAGGGECEVLALGTAPGARRKGLARQLVEWALAEAHRRRACRMILEVADDNEAARRLYGRCGFFPVGCRPRYYRLPSGEHSDALILCRRCDPDH